MRHYLTVLGTKDALLKGKDPRNAGAFSVEGSCPSRSITVDVLTAQMIRLET
jgi:hypothetical protein